MSRNNTEPLHALREHVLALLRGGQAYDHFEDIVDEFPPDRRGTTPPGAEHSAWQILEHLRRTQADVLAFCRAAPGGYTEQEWPKDYWPAEEAPPSADAWDVTCAAFLADRAALEGMVSDPDGDLFTPLPAGDGQTLLREALLAADHASYHLGQLVLLRRLLP